MRRTVSVSVKCGCPGNQPMYLLILLLLQANWTFSKILDEETGECDSVSLIMCSHNLRLRKTNKDFKLIV